MNNLFDVFILGLVQFKNLRGSTSLLESFLSMIIVMLSPAYKRRDGYFLSKLFSGKN